jgi:signal transduction histidine kinase
VIDRSYPLIYNDRGVAREIGILKVEASLAEIYQRLTEKAVVILVTQGLKTFLVSLFILYVFYRLVTRHLTDIARAVGDDDLQRPTPALTLQRHPPDEPDELDRMVQAFNAMRANLQDAYDELRVAHDELAEDIVARRRAEDEVKRLNAVLEQRVRQRTAELEAANKELGAFSYSVAHDLRAPLRRIEGFGRILVEDYTERLDARGMRYLGRIRAGVHEMAEMIDSFLRLSRATQGELSVEPVDLSRQARIVATRLREKDPGRSVFIDIEPDMIADGDRRLLGLVLENLIDNAWKYTRRTEGATITFSRQRDRLGRLVYVVRDNGAGFDMTLVDRLFTPFSRLHRAEDFEGTGIGLATVQRVLARHGGRIWATAEPGRGASFHFTLWEREGGA